MCKIETLSFSKSKFKKLKLKNYILKPLLFWDVTRFGLLAGCRRFGTNYRFHLPVSSNPKIQLGP